MLVILTAHRNNMNYQTQGDAIPAAAKLDWLDTHVQALSSRIATIDFKLVTLSNRVESLDSRFATIDTKLNKLETKLDWMADKLEARTAVKIAKLVRLENNFCKTCER